MKQKFTGVEGEIDKSTTIVWDFNTLLSDRRSSMETWTPLLTKSKLHLVDIYRTVHQTLVE